MVAEQRARMTAYAKNERSDLEAVVNLGQGLDEVKSRRDSNEMVCGEFGAGRLSAR